MDKPISLIIDDLRSGIADSINESKLPACVVRPILENILQEVITAENRQYLSDKKEYEESLTETSE